MSVYQDVDRSIRWKYIPQKYQLYLKWIINILWGKHVMITLYDVYSEALTFI